MAFDIPRNVILPVNGVDVRLDPGPHPFESGNAEAIERNWLAEKAANPALFDGTVMLLSRLVYTGGRLEGRCHAIRFATFMLWRKSQPVPSAEHAFAHAMLVSRDNALVAIRMAGHTVNAGSVYFAAGSFEPCDFVDGVADVDFNMIREVGEETGLNLNAARRGARYYALSAERGTVIFRRYFLDADADEIAAGIRTFVAADPEPEIEGPVVIRNRDDRPEGLKPHMLPLIDWHFSGMD
jgi:8-oxo-dGTP pyrophosphatase MutT (NUDIX family)